MKRHVIVGIIVFIFALPIFGQDEEIQPWVKVEIFNTRVIKGEPIFVHVEKQGTPHAGDYFIDGQKCVERSTFGYVSHLAPGDVPQNQPPSDIRKWKEYSGYLRNICEDWRLKDMRAGKHKLCYKDPLIEGCATFEIQEPVGEDLDVYKMLTPEMRDFTDARPLRKTLLARFPTSTYAVWVLLNYLGKPDKADPSKIFELMEKGTYPMSNSVPDPESKDGWRSMKGGELAEWQNKWIRAILNNHPDFAYALRFRLTLAINHIVLGDAQEGKKMLRDLTKETDKEINRWAQQFLNLIEKRRHQPNRSYFTQ